MKKKIFKIIGTILIIGVSGLGIFVALNWNEYSTMIKNNTMNGEVQKIPESRTVNISDITFGDEDWSGWRGNDGENHQIIKNLKMDWSKGLTKKWEINFLCSGENSSTWSAPSVQGNRLIVCGRDKENDIVFCLNPETGELLWKKTNSAKPASDSYGTGFRATPFIDKDRVYTFSRSGDLICWNLFDGEKIWHKNVNDFGGEEPKWGHSTSPLVTEKYIIVNGGGSARTIAFDKKNGELKWKTGENKAGYAALRKIILNGVPAVLSFYGEGIAAMDIETGKLLWNSEWKTSYDVNATTPVYKDNLIFITSGYNTGCSLLEANEKSVKTLWKNKSIAAHHSDPFIFGEYIYGYSGQSTQNAGYFKCVEFKTGKEKWRSNEAGWGFGVGVNKEYILTCDIKGNLYLIKPNPDKFILVTRVNNLLGEVSGAHWTTPVLSNGNLYLRYNQKLVCYNIRNDDIKK